MNTELAKNINCIAEFLAQRDTPQITPEDKIDLLVLLGNGLVGSIYATAQILRSGAAKRLLISGGVGHSTHYLYSAMANFPPFSDIVVKDRSEADIFADILTSQFDIDPADIIIENTSTNCGTNAEQSRKVLDKLGVFPFKILLIQDPTMQRRSQACFERAWQDRPEVKILSYAPFVPKIKEVRSNYVVQGDDYPVWDTQRFISLALGEVPRLKDDENGYGPNGRNFFGHVEIPAEVLAAYQYVYDNNPDLVREIPG